MLIGYILLLCFGIFLLMKGSDWFVDSGSEIGKRFKISEIVLGVTLVAFGTSLPELIIAITSSQSGSSEIALGNILGTNLFNIAVILAMIVLIRPVRFKKETVRKDMYMSVIAALVFLVVMSDKIIDGSNVNILSRTDGIVLLVLFGMYMYYTLNMFHDYWNERKEKQGEVKLKLKDIDMLTKDIFLMIAGIAMIFIGANSTVRAIENIALLAGVSETLISVIVLAIGTSLPEIFTSIAAIKKNKHDIAIGNLIGSNMFNTLFVVGVAATIRPIELPMDSLIVDAFAFLAVSVLLMMHARNGRKYEMAKWEGISLIAIYIAYLVFVIARG